MYTLYARAGWGSALIETQLAWYGLPYRLEGIGDLFKEEAAGEKLRPVNPLMQLPTLVLPDGQIMTESAAITLYLAEATGRSDLVPPPPRPQFLRWLVFVIANIYPTHTYADVPGRFVAGEEAQRAFEANVNAYARRLWEIMEAQASAPWFLGAHFTQTVRKLTEFGVKQREERAVRESERLGLIGRLTRPKRRPGPPVRADRAA